MERKKSKKVNPVPKGMRTVTPFLMVNDAEGFIKFLKNAFAAELTYKLKAEGKIMHATVKLGDSLLMIADVPETYEPKTSQLYVYLEDVDKVYQKALKAGGTSFREPITEFYGDRSGAVQDDWGNTWWIATHVEDVSEEELKKREKEFRKQQKKAKLGGNHQQDGNQQPG